MLTSLSVLRENQQFNTSTRYPECLRRMKPESWSQVRKNRVKNRVVVREKSNERGKDRVGHLKSDTSVGLTVSRWKEFCCNLCDKKFSTKMTMRRHMGIHQGDKPFKCPHCHYCARLKASLIQHLRVHTGEKPYKCSQCSYVLSVPTLKDTHTRKALPLPVLSLQQVHTLICHKVDRLHLFHSTSVTKSEALHFTSASRRRA
uniref:C2H2-type domain-containing protein n=1 Tax=Sinocyclocheilus grahami TaxID=75366 RepID=A0A672MG59_SINGR